MKKGAVFAGLLFAAFLASTMSAQAGTHISFGVSIGVPAVPYGYYPYPAYAYPAPVYYSGYYVPVYRTYVAPRYYGNGNRYYDSRGYKHNKGNRWIRDDRRYNNRSRSGRWRD